MTWLRENWFKLGILIALFIGVIGFLVIYGRDNREVNLNVSDIEAVESTPMHDSSTKIQSPSTTNNNIDYYSKCKEEVEETFASVDRLVQETPDITTEQAQAIARRAGITDENNYVIDQDILIKACIEEKRDIYE